MVQHYTDTVNKTPLYFVIGKERSGTTLLQVMLNTHPNIVAPPESCFIMLLYLKYGSKVSWSEKDVNAFCNDLFKEDIFRDYWGIDKDKLCSDLIQVRDALNYSLLCKIVFSHFAKENKNVSVYIDKNPIYYYFINDLKKIFPDAKFIHIVRDYRANIISQRKVSATFFNIADMAYRWLKVHQLIEKAKSKMPEQWITIKYESLVTDAKQVMQELCIFLNVPFNENIVEAHNTKLFPSFYENINKDAFKKFHSSVFQPVNSSFIDDWKKTMTKKEQLVAETITGEYADKVYGYKRAFEKRELGINLTRMMIVKLKYFIASVYFSTSLKHRSTFFLHKYIIRHIVRLFNR